jgi:major membrane immunogen (membrane-anchored lipoprotein)
MKPVSALVLALLLVACGARDEPDASGITPSEAQALNDAAAMLDNDSVALNALEEPSR